MKKESEYHKSLIIKLLILLILVSVIKPFFGPAIFAQDPVKRPKLGLALSGGAAHGIAHIGLLKVMEEEGLRPDYITGVSMGSIVGGMYSMGYSADSIKNILKSIDWSLVLGNRIPENKIIFLEKNHFYNSIISLPVSFKKVQLPSGLINGQQMENMLSYYCWPAADINDFSKLPIPFHCMGSDIVTGSKIELKTGYLPEALRSSSAIPSIFTPFTIDTCILVDGGLFRNIAVDEVKAMGADIVIASYTGFYPLSNSVLQSVDGLIRQIGLLESYKDFNEQIGSIDYLVEPYTYDVSMMDFGNVDTLVERGYKAAVPYREAFRRLADSLNNIGPQEPLKPLLDKQLYSFDKIEITGNKVNTDAQILGVLNIKPGEKVDKDRLTEAIELLYGKAWFDKIRYRITPRNDSLILVVDCIEKPRAMLYGSIHYDSFLESGLLISFSGKNLVTRKSIINIDSYIGKNYRLKSSVIQFVDRNQKYGISADYFTERTPLPLLTVNKESGKMVTRNFFGGLSLNARIGLNHMMRLIEEIEYFNLTPDFISGQGLNRLSYNNLTTTVEYLANTLDKKYFPDKGFLYSISISSSKPLSAAVKSDTLNASFDASIPGDFSFERFHTLHGSFRYYFPANRKTTMCLKADALYTNINSSLTAQYSYFFLGGTEVAGRRSIPMTGFHANEIPVRNVAGIGAEVDFEAIKDLHLDLATNVFTIQEAGRESGYSILFGYGLSLSYMSIAGPLQIGIMHGIYSEETHFNQVKGFISFGYNF